MLHHTSRDKACIYNSNTYIVYTYVLGIQIYRTCVGKCLYSFIMYGAQAQTTSSSWSLSRITRSLLFGGYSQRNLISPAFRNAHNTAHNTHIPFTCLRLRIELDTPRYISYDCCIYMYISHSVNKPVNNELYDKLTSVLL